MKRRILSLLLMLALTLPCLPAAQAAPAVRPTELFSWQADGTKDSTGFTTNHLLKEGVASTWNIWGHTATIDLGSGTSECGILFFYNNSRDDASYGLPVRIHKGIKRNADALRITMDNLKPISVRGNAAINLKLTYVYNEGNGDNPAWLDDFHVYVSMDGKTFLPDFVTIRNFDLLGVTAKNTDAGKRLWFFDLETENLLDIPGVKGGDRIQKIMLVPHDGLVYSAGSFGLHSVKVNGYSTLDDFDAAVPAIPSAHVDEATQRRIVLNWAETIANFEWTPKQTVTTACPVGTFSDIMTALTQTYLAGLPYRGPVYEQLYKMDLESILQYYPNGTYGSSILEGIACNGPGGGYTPSTAMGMDCTGFTYDSLSRVTRSYRGRLLWESESDEYHFPLMGGLKRNPDVLTSFTDVDIIAFNTAQEVYEAYAQMKPGDVLNQYDGAAIHTRLVYKDPVVVRSADGAIDPAKSKFSIIEQYSIIHYLFRLPDGSTYLLRAPTPEDLYAYQAAHPEAKLLYGSSSRVDYPFTFKELYDSNYVPFTVQSYRDEKIYEPQTRTIVEPKDGEDIANGANVYVATDYHITYLDIEIHDLTQDRMVYSYRMDPKIHNMYRYGYSYEGLGIALRNLTDGKYRLDVKTTGGCVTEVGAGRPVHTDSFEFTVTGRPVPTEITMSVSPASVKAGETVEVTLNGKGAMDAVDAEVAFDGSAFTYEGGSFAFDAPASLIERDKSVVRLMCAGAGFTGGKLATLKFTATKDADAGSIMLKGASATTAAAASSGAMIRALDRKEEVRLPSGADYRPSQGFIDVREGAWYRKAVDFVFANGIMSGYSADTFGPENTLSRAMVVQVLYNKEQKPAISAANTFRDIAAGQWYFDAVRWGADKGVVAGYGGGVFKPDDPVTLEQVAVILHNYSGKPAGTGDGANYGAHSDWADRALDWAAGVGLFYDVPCDSLTQPATRAQTAQLLTNFLNG